MLNSSKKFKIFLYLFLNIILQNQIYVNCFDNDIDELFDNPFDKNDFIDEDGSFGSEKDLIFNQIKGSDFQSTFDNFQLKQDETRFDNNNHQNQPSRPFPKVSYPPPRPVNNYQPYMKSDASKTPLNAPYNSQQNKTINSYNPNQINSNSHPIPSYDHISRPHLSHIHPGPSQHSHLHPSHPSLPNEPYPIQVPPYPFPINPENDHNSRPNYYPPQTNQGPLRPYPVNQNPSQPNEPPVNHKPPYPFPINPNSSLNSEPNNYYPSPSQQGPVRPYPVIQTPSQPNGPAINQKPPSPFPVSPNNSLPNNITPSPAEQGPSKPYPVNQTTSNETSINQKLPNPFALIKGDSHQNSGHYPNNWPPSSPRESRPTNQNQSSSSLVNETANNPRLPYPFPVNPNQNQPSPSLVNEPPNNPKPPYTFPVNPNQNQPSPSLVNETSNNPRPPYPFPVNPNQNQPSPSLVNETLNNPRFPVNPNQSQPTNRPHPVNSNNQQNNQEQIKPKPSNLNEPNLNIESRPDPTYERPSDIQKQNNSNPLGQTTERPFNINQNIMQIESNNNNVPSDQYSESHPLEGTALSDTAFEIPSPIFPVIPNHSKEFDFEEELANIGFDLNNSLPLMVSNNLSNDESKQNKYNPFFLRKFDQINTNFSPESHGTDISFIPVIDPEILKLYTKLKIPIIMTNKQQRSPSPVLSNRELEQLDDDLSESDLLMKNYPDSMSKSIDDEYNSEDIPTLLPLIDLVKDEPLSLNNQENQLSLKGLTDLTIEGTFPSITETTTLASIGFQLSNELIQTKDKKNDPDSLTQTLLPFLEPDFEDTIAVDDNLYQLQEQNVNLNPDFSTYDRRTENDLKNKNLDSNSDTTPVIHSTDSSINNQVAQLKDLITESTIFEVQLTTVGKDRKPSEKSRIKLTPWNVHKMSNNLK